jgi:molybdopterin-guanine dinucleotide biosynthesis protein A
LSDALASGTPPTLGILLTGGASRRFGSPKGMVRIKGETLASRLARMISHVCSSSMEVGPGISGLSWVVDDEPRLGPLQALATGWRASRNSCHVAFALALAVDLPLLDEETLARLVRWDSPSSIVPVLDGRAQYLLSRLTAEHMEKLCSFAEQGETSLKAAFAVLDSVLYLDATELLSSPGSPMRASGLRPAEVGQQDTSVIQDFDTQEELDSLLDPKHPRDPTQRPARSAKASVDGSDGHGLLDPRLQRGIRL